MARDEGSPTTNDPESLYSAIPTNTQLFYVEYAQKSPQSGISGDLREVEKQCKLLNLNGGRGRNRTFNPSVKR
jgi:hypothetical protein